MTRRALLYCAVATVLLQVGDIWSTALAAANGGVEQNQLMVDFITRPIYEQLLFKALLFPALGFYLLDLGRWFAVRLSGQEPSAVYLLPLGALASIYTYVILNNLRVAGLL